MKRIFLHLDQRPLELDVRVTTCARERMSGWLGRRRIASRDALLIFPCNAIHTWFMHTSIDVAFLDGSGRVLAIHTDVNPWRFRMQWGACAVLELAPGAILRLGIQRGAVISASGGKTWA